MPSLIVNYILLSRHQRTHFLPILLLLTKCVKYMCPLITNWLGALKIELTFCYLSHFSSICLALDTPPEIRLWSELISGQNPTFFRAGQAAHKAILPKQFYWKGCFINNWSISRVHVVNLVYHASWLFISHFDFFTDFTWESETWMIRGDYCAVCLQNVTSVAGSTSEHTDLSKVTFIASCNHERRIGDHASFKFTSLE